MEISDSSEIPSPAEYISKDEIKQEEEQEETQKEELVPEPPDHAPSSHNYAVDRAELRARRLGYTGLFAMKSFKRRKTW